jgi:hypothetical protein
MLSAVLPHVHHLEERNVSHNIREALKMVRPAPAGLLSACLILLGLLVTLDAPAALEGRSEGRGDRGVSLALVLRAADGHRYALTEGGEVLFSADRGRSWSNRSAGLPKKQVWPFNGEEHRACTALAVQPGSWRRVAATTKKHLFISDNAGRSWQRVPLGPPVKGTNYLTAVCFVPGDEDALYLGTSFNGLFFTRNGGESWEKISEPMQTLYRGAGFYEEISALTMSADEPGVLYLASRFDRSLYRYERSSGRVTETPFPGEMEEFHALSSRGSGRHAVELHGARRRYLYQPASQKWREKPALLLREQAEVVPRGAAQGGTAAEGVPDYADRRGIYLNSWNASGSSLDEHLRFMERHGFDTIVVDVKDDWGKLTYDSDLSAPRRYGAVRGNLNLDRLLEKAHARGFYVVGRIVVFKDRELYHARGQRYAIWDTEENGPWGHKVEEEDPETGKLRKVQREFWVDPFSEEVWDYNIAIAEELEERGIDEIQFDYIRFPSDGDLSTVRYRHRRPGMLKVEAIESFMRKVDREIGIPISTDLYGFNSWYRMGNWIGQDITMLSRYADVICPMYYPSHFPSSFLSGNDYLRRAYTIYHTGTLRARQLVEGRSVIRPYVQAFRVGRELRMEEPTYYRYLALQLQGVADAGGSGYTLWNNANRYYMVNGSITALNGESGNGTVQRCMAGP